MEKTRAYNEIHRGLSSRIRHALGKTAVEYVPDQEDPRVNRFGEYMSDETRWSLSNDRTGVRLLTPDEQTQYHQTESVDPSQKK